MSPVATAQFDRIVSLVRDVAASEILPGFRAMTAQAATTKTSPVDIVTAYDRRAEETLTAGIAAIFPDAAIVGEEAVSADPRSINLLDSDGTVVVIDPIDGTWNYAGGIGVFGVLIAVVRNRQTVFGLLYDPLGNDWIRTQRGGGTWFCREGSADHRLSVSPDPCLRGFLPHRPTALAGLYDALPPHTRLTALGSSCHEYRALVSGHADFLLAYDPAPWDHLAGTLALTEAGGTASRRIGPGRYIAARNAGVLSSVERATPPA